MLTKLSFEIKTEIRFIPNDAAPRAKKDDEEAPASEEKTKLPKPEVTAQVAVRDRSKEGRRHPRRREEP